MKIKFLTEYRMKQAVCVILGVCAAFFLTDAVLKERTIAVQQRTAQLQKNLAKEVFRFHVLADSDSEEDQAVKLKVRDQVISYMKKEMKEDQVEDSAQGTKRWAAEHLKELEQVSEEVIREEGYSYDAHAQITNCYFPEKRYGDVTFPKGYYEALRICLGSAKGHNWWCVLYPNLCFTDSTCAVVDEKGKGKLKSTLTAEEYEMVTAVTEFKMKSYFLEKLSRRK